MGKRLDLSVIIPSYNEERNLLPLFSSLNQELIFLKKSFEIIFIDDGSTDASLKILKEIYQKHKGVRIFSFRRNLGKSTALAYGFKQALGKIIITMDADLQDKPDQIPKLLVKLSEDIDLVCGWRYDRKDPASKIFVSHIFNFITAALTGTHLHDINCGFKVFKREVIEDIKVYGELHRFIPVLASWQGFKVGEVKISHAHRRFGKSKFGLGRYYSGFLDLLTVMFLTHYFRKPLHMFGLMGVISFLLGAFTIIYFELRKYILGILIGEGRPIIQVAVFLMMFGVQVFIFGLLAEIITHSQSADDQFLIKEKLG